MATTVARLQAVLAADTRDFDKGMNRSEGRIGKLGKAAALGGLAIAGGLAVGMKKSVDAALEAEKAEVRLTSAMDKAKIGAKQRALANEAISKTSKRAALDDEELSDVFSKLLRTTGSVKKATEGMNLSADIARSRNISLAASSKAVERAYNGTGAGLSRFGVQVDKVTTNYVTASEAVAKHKESMKGLSGAQLEAAKVQLNQLEAAQQDAKLKDKQAAATNALKDATKQFAGSAEAYGKTAAGAQERFKVAVENLQESVGKRLLPILAKMMEWAVRVIEYIERNWPRIAAVINPIMEDIRRVIRNVLEATQRFWETHGETVMRILNTIKSVVQNWVQVIRGIFDVFIGLLTGDWRQAWNGIKGIVEGVLNNIKLLFTNILPLLVQAAKKIGTEIKNAIVDGITGLGKALWQKVLDAVDWVISKVPSLPKIELNPLKWGDARDPNMTMPAGTAMGGINLMGANPIMAPFAAAAAQFGLGVTSGLRPGAITANGTPSDHGIGKALDVSGSASGMAGFFKALLGNPAVKQAFYDPLGSIFGGAWSSYREGGHSDHVHVATYDKGGVLPPGYTMAYNGTGRNEYVGSGGVIQLQVNLDGKEFARAIFDPLRNENTRQGRLGRGM